MRVPSLLLFTVLTGTAHAQFPGLTLPPSGDIQKASVTQFIGPVKVAIDYSSPRVTLNGQDRRGKIWGQLVPYGLSNPGFGTAKEAPWRAGANENTVFAVSHPVSIDGQPLPAGRYGLHMIAGADEFTLIFSKNSTSWGSFFYDAAEDALRVKVKPRKADYREWLSYEFTTRKPDEASVELRWEEIAVPWTIRAANVDDIYLTKLKEEVRTVPGFNWQGFVAASQYLSGTGKNLDLALEWADAAIGRAFVGETNFATLTNKSQVLAKMGRAEESAKLFELALKHPSATVIQLHQAGRQLLTGGKKAEALRVFEMNHQRNGDAWPVHVGLARAYIATGDNTKALDHAKKALAQAPDPVNKTNLANMVKALEEGKPFTN